MSGVGTVLVVVAAVALLIAILVLFTGITERRVERALPPTGSFVDVNGARIDYIERGAGPVTRLMVKVGRQRVALYAFGGGATGAGVPGGRDGS